MYIIESGESQVVEANPDAVGLKVGTYITYLVYYF